MSDEDIDIEGLDDETEIALIDDLPYNARGTSNRNYNNKKKQKASDIIVIESDNISENRNSPIENQGNHKSIKTKRITNKPTTSHVNNSVTISKRTLRPKKTTQLGENSRTMNIRPKRNDNKKSQNSFENQNTYKVRWTDEETDTLLYGINLYGFGKWKQIESLIKTRTSLQIKNRARHLKDTNLLKGMLRNYLAKNKSMINGNTKRSQKSRNTRRGPATPSKLMKRTVKNKGELKLPQDEWLDEENEEGEDTSEYIIITDEEEEGLEMEGEKEIIIDEDLYIPEITRRNQQNSRIRGKNQSRGSYRLKKSHSNRVRNGQIEEWIIDDPEDREEKKKLIKEANPFLKDEDLKDEIIGLESDLESVINIDTEEEEEEKEDLIINYSPTSELWDIPNHDSNSASSSTTEPMIVDSTESSSSYNSNNNNNNNITKDDEIIEYASVHGKDAKRNSQFIFSELSSYENYKIWLERRKTINTTDSDQDDSRFSLPNANALERRKNGRYSLPNLSASSRETTAVTDSHFNNYNSKDYNHTLNIISPISLSEDENENEAEKIEAEAEAEKEKSEETIEEKEIDEENAKKVEKIEVEEKEKSEEKIKEEQAKEEVEVKEEKEKEKEKEKEEIEKKEIKKVEEKIKDLKLKEEKELEKVEEKGKEKIEEEKIDKEEKVEKVEKSEEIPSDQRLEEDQDQNTPSSSPEDIPITQFTIDKDRIHPMEKILCPKWFPLDPGTPAQNELRIKRYMTIRNFMLNQWEKQKPNYVSKCFIREHLKKQGSVNAMGWIHDFLEDNGFINQGAQYFNARWGRILEKRKAQRCQERQRKLKQHLESSSKTEKAIEMEQEKEEEITEELPQTSNRKLKVKGKEETVEQVNEEAKVKVEEEVEAKENENEPKNMEVEVKEEKMEIEFPLEQEIEFDPMAIDDMDIEEKEINHKAIGLNPKETGKEKEKEVHETTIKTKETEEKVKEPSTEKQKSVEEEEDEKEKAKTSKDKGKGKAEDENQDEKQKMLLEDEKEGGAYGQESKADKLKRIMEEQNQIREMLVREEQEQIRKMLQEEEEQERVQKMLQETEEQIQIRNMLEKEEQDQIRKMLQEEEKQEQVQKMLQETEEQIQIRNMLEKEEQDQIRKMLQEEEEQKQVQKMLQEKEEQNQIRKMLEKEEEYAIQQMLIEEEQEEIRKMLIEEEQEEIRKMLIEEQDELQIISIRSNTEPQSEPQSEPGLESDDEPEPESKSKRKSESDDEYHESNEEEEEEEEEEDKENTKTKKNVKAKGKGRGRRRGRGRGKAKGITRKNVKEKEKEKVNENENENENENANENEPKNENDNENENENENENKNENKNENENENENETNVENEANDVKNRKGKGKEKWKGKQPEEEDKDHDQAMKEQEEAEVETNHRSKRKRKQTVFYDDSQFDKPKKKVINLSDLDTPNSTTTTTTATTTTTTKKKRKPTPSSATAVASSSTAMVTSTDTNTNTETLDTATTSTPSLIVIDEESNTFDPYDPFRLIKLESFNKDDKPAPFTVDIQSNVLMFVDIHSHLFKTEVIGLLGGIYDPIDKVIYVKDVFPCKGESSNYECEMNPESEMEARELFTSRDLNVVGWYHSHPTFEPNPSIRDIENQSQYQQLFRNENGDEPFIGLIISPYYNYVHHSKIKVYTISKEWDNTNNHLLPYEYEPTLSDGEGLGPNILKGIIQLLKSSKNDKSRINFNRKYGKGKDFTYYDKLTTSLQSYITALPEMEATYLTELLKDYLNPKK